MVDMHGHEPFLLAISCICSDSASLWVNVMADIGDLNESNNSKDNSLVATMNLSNQEEQVDFSKASKARQILTSAISIIQFIIYITLVWPFLLPVCLGGFASGNCLGWSSPTQPQIQFNTPNLYEVQNSTWYIRVTPNEMSWAGSVMNIGAIVGSIAAGLFCGTLGPQVFFDFRSFAIYTMLYFGRIIAGLGHGFCLATVPSYLSEISTPNLRGTTGFLFTFSVYLGTLAMSAFGLSLYWRYFSIIPLLPLALLVVGMICIPESPILLLKKGKREQALQSLQKLRGPSFNCQLELKNMEDFVNKNSAFSVNMNFILLPHVYKPIFIGILLMIFQQFAGVNVVGFYSAEIFRLAGSNIDPLKCSLIINSVGIASISLIGTTVADRLPRRYILVVCEAMSCLALLCLGLYFHLMDTPAVSNLRWLPLACLIMTTLSVACGLGAIPWIIASEILPIQFRGPGSSVIAFSNRLMSFIVTKTFVDLQTGLTSAGAFWVYAGCCCLGTVFTLVVVPETKGKSQAEIQKYFVKE